MSWKIPLLIAVLVCGIWKCHYGIEIYDEPFYLAPGFKLFALGDLPFQTEILNGPRLHDLFNHFLVRPLFPFDVLNLRIVAFGLFGLLLLALARVVTAQALSLPVCLLLGTLLLYDGLSPHSWSYSHWARNGLLAHAALLVWAQRSPRYRSILFVFAGVLAGITVLCYNPLIVAILCAGICLAWGKSPWRPYALGVLLTLGAGAAYVLQPTVYPRWKQSVEASALFARITTNVFSIDKIRLLLGYTVTRPELWFFAGIFGAVRKQKPWLAGALFTAVAARASYVHFKSDAHSSAWVLGTLISLGLAAGLWQTALALREKNGAHLAITLSALVGAFAMGLSSWSANGALYWLLAVPAILHVARTENARGLYLPLTLGLVMLFTVRFTLTHSYGDVSPAESSRVIAHAPLQGIRTSPGRARLLEALGEHLSGQPFVLAYPSLPAAFIFPMNRSAVDSLWVSVDAPLELRLKSLAFLRDSGRTPSRLVKLKTNGWSWGKAPVEILRDQDGAYDSLYDCAKGESLFSAQEMEIVIPGPQFGACLEQVLATITPAHS